MLHRVFHPGVHASCRCDAQIVRHGRVVRPGLGVVCLPDNVMASVLQAADRGVIIKEVVPGSGAAEMGLRCAPVPRLQCIDERSHLSSRQG